LRWPLIFIGFGYVSSTMFRNASLAEMALRHIRQGQRAAAGGPPSPSEKSFREVRLPDQSAIKQAIADRENQVRAGDPARPSKRPWASSSKARSRCTTTAPSRWT